MDRAILPLLAARMRRARQTGHDRLRQRLAAGRRLGRFRAIHAIRGWFPAALAGLRSHDGGLHYRVNNMVNSLLCKEKIASLFARAGLRKGRFTGWGGRRRDEGRRGSHG